MEETKKWLIPAKGRKIKYLYRLLAAVLARDTLPLGIKNVCLCLNLDQCNLRCIMCWQTYARPANRKMYHTRNMPRNDLLRLLRNKQLAEATISVVGGGEPFLYPYLDDLLVEAPTEHRRLMIMTNGTLLHEKPLFWEIAKTAPITLSFSIDAATPETYGKIRPPGDWPVLVNNIERYVELRRANPRLGFLSSFVVLKQNLSELMDFMRLNAKWGSEYVHIHPAISANFPEEWRVDLSDPVYLSIMAEVIEFARLHSIALDRPAELLPPEELHHLEPASGQDDQASSTSGAASKWKLPPNDPRRGCTMHTESMTINHLGQVYLCDTAFRVYYTCGNVLANGIEKTWLSTEWLSVRLAHKLRVPHLHPLCQKCLFLNNGVSDLNVS